MALYRRFGTMPSADIAPGVRVDTRKVDAALEWCQDPDRPGVFTASEIRSYPDMSGVWLFFFSDRNVAFEFKMVWG